MPVEQSSYQLNGSLKKRSHMSHSSKKNMWFFSLRTVQYTIEILLQKYAFALSIVFYRIKGSSMSKTQYKRGKIIAFLQKMRLSHILKKLNVYKPCLLIVDINGTNLIAISNRDFKVFGLSSKHASSTKIKSLFAMYFKCYKFYSKHK